jgi:two-component system chemotaxis response regulator CheB
VSLAAIDRKADRRIRVMIVDDSAVVRGLTRRWLEAETGIEIVRVCVDGEQAVRDIAAAQPDVVLLDIEMPRLDGLATLPLLRQASPGARIIMASTLTGPGATATVRALQLGAADCIAKPSATGLAAADDYRRDLVAKIHALGKARPTAINARPTPVALRSAPTARVKPSALVVAASTGGPQALQTFLSPIARRISAPILIVQHMPSTFIPIFATRLTEALGKPCRLPADGEEVTSGALFIAPGDHHMRIARGGSGMVVRLDRSEPVNFCRPAADPLFESAAAAFGSRLLAVVLTGMGQDGKAGAGKIVEAGGRVAVQDEASSVVWGMPGSVALAGYAEAVRPLPELSSLTLNLMNGDAA